MIGVVVRLAKVLEIMLAEVGLTMNQFRLLTLVQEGAPSKAELSLRLVMKPPNVTVLTSGLVKRRLLKESRSADDGRRRALELTRAGSALVAAANERCALALHFLADSSSGGTDLLGSLEGWLPALDDAAVEVRKLARGRRAAGPKTRNRQPTRKASGGRRRV